MKFLNTPSEADAESKVAKYAYVPFGYSGVIQNLPLFSSRTESSFDTLKVKSSTKNSGGNALTGGLLSFLLASSTYPDFI